MHSTKTLLTALAACSLIGTANAAVVAQFDLGVAGGPVATGYEEVTVPEPGVSTSASGTQNGITVTVTATTVLDSRTRGTNGTYINDTLNPGSDPDPTLGELTPVLRDWFFDLQNDDAADLTVQFAGLLANTDYTITAIHFESSGGQTTFVTDWYEGADNTGTLLGTWNGDRGTALASTDLVELSVTTDGAGTVNLFMDPTTGPSRINGFIVDQVPEPSSLALLGLGGLLVARRRRG